MTLRKNLLAGIVLLALAEPALASELSGKALENVANAISWVVLVCVPVAGIYLFWILHIWPEKIAHKKRHPQKEAIHALCLLSLFFGGLLWPLAWLWAHTKPVFYRAAYGTDKAPEDDESPEVSNTRTDGGTSYGPQGAVALRASTMATAASAMRSGKEPI